MPTDSLININGESVQTLEILFLTDDTTTSMSRKGIYSRNPM